MTAFNAPHNTFTVDVDSPFPGGDANGVGNRRPKTPFTKCGTAFTRKNQAKNQAAYTYQAMLPSFSGLKRKTPSKLPSQRSRLPTAG